MKIDETLASDEVEKLWMVLSSTDYISSEESVRESDETNAEEEFKNFRKKSLPWRSDCLFRPND